MIAVSPIHSPRVDHDYLVNRTRQAGKTAVEDQRFVPNDQAGRDGYRLDQAAIIAFDFHEECSMRMKSLVTWLVVATIVTTAVALTAQSTTPRTAVATKAGLATDRVARIDRALQRYVDENRIAGIAATGAHIVIQPVVQGNVFQLHAGQE